MTTPRAAHLRTRRDGFTLIEVLVALTALALLSLALVEGLRAGQRLQQRAIEATREQGQLLAAQRWLRRAVESALPDARAPLVGRADRLQFRAETSTHTLLPTNARLELAVEAAPDRSLQLIARWHNDEVPSGSPQNTEVLLDRLASARWRYRAANGTGDGAWLDHWNDAHVLPTLVRLDVTFPAGDRRRWPDWVVAPRLNVAAGCLFDVIAQRCRATS